MFAKNLFRGSLSQAQRHEAQRENAVEVDPGRADARAPVERLARPLRAVSRGRLSLQEPAKGGFHGSQLRLDQLALAGEVRRLGRVQLSRRLPQSQAEALGQVFNPVHQVAVGREQLGRP